MKKEYIAIILLIIGSAFFIKIIAPIKELLIYLEITNINAKLISGIVTRALLISILIYLATFYNLKDFTGIKSLRRTKNLQSIVIVTLIIAIGIFDSWDSYLETANITVILFGISVLLIGTFEELLFRGTILPLIIIARKENKNVILISVFISSLLFGLIHYVNLFNEPDNFWGITSQVIFAFAIGVFFSGLLLRTGSIYIPAIIHGLINFAFSAKLTLQGKKSLITEVSNNESNGLSIAMNVLFLLFIVLGGIYMIRKIKVEQILNKLDINTTTNNG